VSKAQAATVGDSEPVVPVGEAPAGALPELQVDAKTSLTIQEVALAAHIAKDLPPDTEPGLSATYFFEPKNFTFPFGTHIVSVEIDRETGDVNFLRYVAVDDCGKVINPMLVDGQIHGGIVQSLGQAMFDEVVYDDQGQLVTGTLMDYAVPLHAHHADDRKILAGGDSLIPAMKLRLAQPQLLIDIGRIADLAYIREEADQIRIGAMTTHYAIESSKRLQEICPLLPACAA